MTGPSAEAPPEIRLADEADVPAIVALAARVLGWEDSAATAAHFAWKHFDNPAGRSDLWVAEAGGRIVAVRSFLRWDLVEPEGRVRRAARAVDTGTDAAFRRRGLFTRLTTAGLERLRADGVELVFNTPNDQSRPANLTLGWEVVGRLRAVVRPSGLRGLAALARARTPAERGALSSTVGEPAADVLADPRRAAALAARAPHPRGLATRRTASHLAWRYGHAPLHYRVVEAEGAVVVLHLRRRGRAVEAVICEAFPPSGAHRVPGAVLRDLARETGADYLLGLAAPARPGPGFVPVPGGPVLTARGVTGRFPTDRRGWDLAMGDVEGL